MGALLFSILGIAAYQYGKKAARPHIKWVGVALMLYPYVISDTGLLYGVGAGLCAAIYWFHRQGY
jgi:hypothetical protein